MVADNSSAGVSTTSDNGPAAQESVAPKGASSGETAPETATEAGPDTSDSKAADSKATASKSTTPKATARRTKAASKPRTSTQKSRARATAIEKNPVLVNIEGLTKRYDQTLAASNVSLEVREGSFFGIVGPNGAGKTTVLSMISGLNRPTSGTVTIAGSDVWLNPTETKRLIGILPDRLRLFDRLTGAQLLFYAGILNGLDDSVANDRAKKLSRAFGLESALNRPVTDYSAGMAKKIALAAAMIHAPRVLVLDEPFEAIDPVSAATLTELLDKFVQSGGSVILSSHSLELIQRTCDHVAVIVKGEVIAQGTVDEVRDGKSLAERFESLTTEDAQQGAMEWLFRSSASD